MLGAAEVTLHAGHPSRVAIGTLLSEPHITMGQSSTTNKQQILALLINAH